MGDPKNIKTGKSLTGGKGYLTVEESKKIAPVAGIIKGGDKATSAMIQNKQAKADILKETGGY